MYIYTCCNSRKRICGRGFYAAELEQAFQFFRPIVVALLVAKQEMMVKMSCIAVCTCVILINSMGEESLILLS